MKENAEVPASLKAQRKKRTAERREILIKVYEIIERGSSPATRFFFKTIPPPLINHIYKITVLEGESTVQAGKATVTDIFSKKPSGEKENK